MDVRKIKTAPGLEFDCSLAGSPDGVPVLLLHGFGVPRHFRDRRNSPQPLMPSSVEISTRQVERVP